MQSSYLSSSPVSSSILPSQSDDPTITFCILDLDCEAGSEEEKTISFLYDLFNSINIAASDVSYLPPLPDLFLTKDSSEY